MDLRLAHAIWHVRYCHMAGCPIMTQADYVLDVLGGEAVFHGPRRSDPAALRTRIKSGLPYRSLESVCRRLQLTLPETAAILHTPMRTLARRKRGRN